MKESLRKLISCLFGFIIILTSSMISFNFQMASASETQRPDLAEKISKDFTKKFCNSIGFGLSKESAMKFSFEENKKIFENRKGIKDIDQELLAKKIATSVIDNCGYPINLSGENGIKDFESYYLSINKENT